MSREVFSIRYVPAIVVSVRARLKYSHLVTREKNCVEHVVGSHLTLCNTRKTYCYITFLSPCTLALSFF